MYDIIVLNRDTLSVIAIVDDYIELLWVERYNDAGEFSLYVPPRPEYIELFQLNTVLVSPFSDKIMVVVKRELVTDSDEGDRFLIRGTSFEGLMKRRVDGAVRWDPETNPPNRPIDPFMGSIVRGAMGEGYDIGYPNVIYTSSTDQKVLDAKVSYNITSRYTFDVVQSICTNAGMGFKFFINENKKIAFLLYKGVDRSSLQVPLVNSVVTFSPEFDNLLSSNYQDGNENYVNVLYSYLPNDSSRFTVYRETDPNFREKYPYIGAYATLEALIAAVPNPNIGDIYRVGTAYPQRIYIWGVRDGVASWLDYGPNIQEGFAGWDRYEHRSQAPQTNTGQYAPIDSWEIFKDHNLVKVFDGEVDLDGLYKLNEDFFLGDIVDVENEYGLGDVVRLNELTTTVNSEGVSVLPVFVYLTGQYEPTWSERQTVSKPVVTPNGGSFESAQIVSISCGTPGASIYYTTDGSNPSTASTYYSGPFQIDQSTQIRAIAVNNYMNDSDIVVAQFTKIVLAQAPAPSITFTYDNSLDVITAWFSSYITGATIHFRFRSNWMSNWNPWSTGQSIRSLVAYPTEEYIIVEAYVTAPGYLQSNVATAQSKTVYEGAGPSGPKLSLASTGGASGIPSSYTYRVQWPCAYSGSVANGSPAGSRIYYTTNGSTPTTSSNWVDGTRNVFTLPESEWVNSCWIISKPASGQVIFKYLGTAPGYQNSDIYTAVFTWR